MLKEEIAILKKQMSEIINKPQVINNTNNNITNNNDNKNIVVNNKYILE